MSTTDIDGSESETASVENTTIGEKTPASRDRAKGFRITTPAAEVSIIVRCDPGITWMAHPEAQMQPGEPLKSPTSIEGTDLLVS